MLAIVNLTVLLAVLASEWRILQEAGLPSWMAFVPV